MGFAQTRSVHRKLIQGTKSEKLSGKRIVLCVCGSIAAVECIKLARELMRHGAEVFSVMSDAAQKIIHPYALEFASGNPVVTELTGKVEHVDLVGDYPGKADLVLVCPATANTISKIASGIDDTPVTSVVSTGISHVPILIVPAMHASMYENPIIKKNIHFLEEEGITFLHPKMEEGKAKLPDIIDIVYAVMKELYEKDLAGKTVLVTAGGTIEEIDDVRFIANKSSGKMGMYIAEEFDLRGASVTLVLGRTSEKPMVDTVVRAGSFGKMYEAVMERASSDIIVLAAAASDFSVVKRKGKITSNNGVTLELIPNKKIIADIGKKSDGFIVGFKAEHSLEQDVLITCAHRKLTEYGIDMMVANDVGKPDRGFHVDTNEVFIVDKDKNVEHVPLSSKRYVAERIVDAIRKRI
ncbi:MAG: bifunctional phosphopantothenoylcysteine decarboxylase/phosphopantothenate--cysteine ligase CoaBC [Theionarchaea archaeon]|nr:bifunctional phosphopantothenoylcysteine decarboxylase/phosphopantothenate--cysteine ligase CoaBC [Theionarchaea archaeon]